MSRCCIFLPLIFITCSNEPVSSEALHGPSLELTEAEDTIEVHETGPLYTASGKFTPGIFTDSGYVNKYFNFQIFVGSEWEILDKFEQERLLDISKSDLSDKNLKFEKDFDASRANWFEILSLRKNDWVPWVNFMAEKIEPIPEVNNAMEYLQYSKSYILTKDPNKATFPIYTGGSISVDSLSGREFLIQNFRIQNENNVYYQSTYSAQFDDYLLNIVTNYENESQKAEITTFLNTLKWID